MPFEESMVKTAAVELMSAEADALCGARLGEVSDRRVDRRCGYRNWTWHTEAGPIKLIIPRLRAGSYSPDWLLKDPGRAERALVALVAGRRRSGVSVRRLNRLIKELGITGVPNDRAALIAETLNRQAGTVTPEHARPSWRALVPYAVCGTITVVLLIRLFAPIHIGSLLLILLVTAGFLCAGMARWAVGLAAGTGSAPRGTPGNRLLAGLLSG